MVERVRAPRPSCFREQLELRTMASYLLRLALVAALPRAALADFKVHVVAYDDGPDMEALASEASTRPELSTFRRNQPRGVGCPDGHPTKASIWTKY